MKLMQVSHECEVMLVLGILVNVNHTLQFKLSAFKDSSITISFVVHCMWAILCADIEGVQVTIIMQVILLVSIIRLKQTAEYQSGAIHVSKSLSISFLQVVITPKSCLYLSRKTSGKKLFEQIFESFIWRENRRLPPCF